MASAAAVFLPGPVVEYPDELQCVDLKVLPNKVCAKAHPQKVTDVMMCVGNLEGGKDTCAVSRPAPPPPARPGLSMLGGGRGGEGGTLRFWAGVESYPGLSLQGCWIQPPPQCSSSLLRPFPSHTPSRVARASPSSL